MTINILVGIVAAIAIYFVAVLVWCGVVLVMVIVPFAAGGKKK